MVTISVVIPTLNAGTEIGSLLDRLLSQTVQPQEVLVVDSESEDGTVSEALSRQRVRVLKIRRSDFNHGYTRDMAFRNTSSDLVCFLTQDALPSDAHYIENLTRPLIDNPYIAMTSGRQVPRGDARRFEALVRECNYPPMSAVRTSADIFRLGLKAFFASDVCSAYRRASYLACGGFPRCQTNEDMIMAARLLKGGYAIAYVAEATVVHSHNLSMLEQFKRYRAIGGFLDSFADELYPATAMKSGSDVFRSVSKRLISEKDAPELTAFFGDCLARLVGMTVGRHSNRVKRKIGRSE